MTDIGMMNDPSAIQKALDNAHVSMHQLLGKGVDAAELRELDEASYYFHQLSALLDLYIQERTTAARPQEEANEHHQGGSATTDPELADGLSEHQESVDGPGGPPVR